MKKSEFLKRLADAVMRLIREYNGPDVDKKTFDWARQARYYSRVTNIDLEPSHGDIDDNPAALAVKLLALSRHCGTGLDFDELIAIEKAWERYEERAQQLGFAQHVDSISE